MNRKKRKNAKSLAESKFQKYQNFDFVEKRKLLFCCEILHVESYIYSYILNRLEHGQNS